ncbi:ferritin-like domain-containing protein [Lentinula aff. lateritia]|uniref:Ferritin-like domain-containing protein n=1 Tax=Lentinula aff. lateritia TaxID=2804960 RepID=A0ACC1TKG3_9AGAR|nr:ferritin-like domain-containing protein [Lentinula aff. lateritia]
MKSAVVIAYVTLIGTATAFVVPQARDTSSNSTTIDDTSLLNYVLTLKNLENAFYAGALNSFTQDDFVNDSLPTWSRARFEQIAEHQQAHVDLLSYAIGSGSAQACNYTFPYTSPSSFAALAEVISGVCVSAFVGAAQYITSSDYLTTAAAILSTEARHAAWIAGPVNHQNAWSGSFDTPLSLDAAYTLASQYISGCPSSNPTLPVTALSPLTIANASLGQASTVSAANNVTVEGQYVAFLSGLTPTFVQVVGGQVVVPATIMGTSYAVLTSSNTSVDDSTVTAGVALIQSPYNSNGVLEVV